MDPVLVLIVALAMGALGLAFGVVVGRRGSVETPPPETPPEKRSDPLGAIAAGIVHEVAQPLSAARVSIEGLHYLRQLGREPTPEQVARTLDRVGMSLVTMTQILDHLRYLAGAGTRSLLPLRSEDSIATLVADRANWLRFSDVDIRALVEAPVPIQGDPSGLRLALANLARNAAEAVAQLPPDRRWLSIQAGPGPCIIVADPGPGLPAEVAARLFQPFISTRGEARGVGLSLAKAAVERMGGTLSHAARPQGGTIFPIRLVPVGGAAP